jgi:5-(carboxyamino)imidazole ribonucleotide mutase
MADVLIIMGSDSDLKVMSEAANFLDEVKVSYDLTVVSAHRTPDRMYDYAKKAKQKGYKIIIAGAGGAAHLPGMVASITSLPVIGVPVQSKTMSGTAINGAKNAGILAARILGINQQNIADNLEEFSNSMKRSVLDKASSLEQKGHQNYLKSMQ